MAAQSEQEFEADYDGNSVFDWKNERDISFPSHSDAMIASLAIAHNASLGLMDAIFSIIHDKSFNTSEMALQNTEDMCIHLAKYDFSFHTTNTQSDSDALEVGGKEIEEPGTSLMTAKPTSVVVLEEVVGWLDDAMQDKYLPRDERSSLRGILMSLALVQRRWVDPVRRILGRSIYIIFSERGQVLDRLLSNPCAGPWTRDLHIYCEGFYSDPGFMKALCIALGERTTCLREFIWYLDGFLAEEGLIESVVSRLGKLRDLVLVHSFGPMATEQSRAINSMPSLKNLTMDGWDALDRSYKGSPPWPAPFNPSPSLRALRVHNPHQMLQLGVPESDLVWTRNNQSDGFFLSTIVLQLTHAFTEIERERMLRYLPRLETLYVTTSADVEENEKCLLWFFDQCQNTMRRLYICTYTFPSEAVLRRVPRKVTKLSLEIRTSPTILKERRVANLLHQLISDNTWPELRIFQIFFELRDMSLEQITAMSMEPSSMPDLFMPDVKVLCEELDIQLSISFCKSAEIYRPHKYIREVLEHLDILHRRGTFLLKRLERVYTRLF
ncbi:hypothetical protein M0805_007185 [Coniferiporia weirii]|nr:hypothetical protein M0805_007185 [Coniferiporia weirii]